MAEEAVSRMESGDTTNNQDQGLCASSTVVTTAQKVVAELLGTYFVIFSGCGSVVVNKIYGGTITFPRICVTWGLIVTVMVYSVSHVFGAHFNPAVTLTFAVFRRFPWKEIGELGGLAVGMTIMLNVFVAGPISGASMNPARSIGPAIVKREFRGIWVYVFGPIIGTILGALL